MLSFQVSALTWEVIYQNARFYPCDGKRLKRQHFSSQNQSASLALASISHPSLNPPICRGKASSAESRLTWSTSPFASTSIKAKSYLRKGYFFLHLATRSQRSRITTRLLPVPTTYYRRAGGARVWLRGWLGGTGGRVGIKQPKTAEPALPAEY